MREKHKKSLIVFVILGFGFCMSANADTLGFGNGVNLQPSYYNGGNVDFGWDFMKKFDAIKTVRIELAPSRIKDTTIFAGWIKEAIDNGYKVIATYHDVTGSPDPADLLKAANWWKDNYSVLSKAGKFTINLANEWGDHKVTSQNYADAYNPAIKIIRQFYDGYIVCDAPGWAQECQVAADASSLIKDKKIIFSVHIYPCAYDGVTKTYMQNSDLDYLETVGKRPVIIGEFGSKASSYHADWSGLVDHAISKGWTIFAWAWNGDGNTDDKNMNMVKPYWFEQTTGPYSKSDYFDTVYNKLSKTKSEQQAEELIKKYGCIS